MSADSPAPTPTTCASTCDAKVDVSCVGRSWCVGETGSGERGSGSLDEASKLHTRECAPANDEVGEDLVDFADGGWDLELRDGAPLYAVSSTGCLSAVRIVERVRQAPELTRWQDSARP
eukprot:2864046-Rhodomonas_salina.5